MGEVEASAGPKGVVGGALLGAELTVGTEALLGVDAWWAYLVGGVAGGAAGGLGGYYVDRGDDAELSTLMLAGGMALFIPATVLVIDATAYGPPAGYTTDEQPTEPAADPPRPSAPAPPTATRRQGGRRWLSARRKPALVDYGAGSLRLGIPAVELRNVYSPHDLLQYGLSQATEIRFPVVRCAF